MKRKNLRFFTMISLSVIFALSLLAGCGKSSEQINNNPVDPLEETDGLADGGMTYLEGYPITKEPITITAAIGYSTLRPNMDTTEVWKKVAEKTNIHLKIETIKDEEKKDLMFAGNDFPELLMGGIVNDNRLANAAEGGQLFEMKPLIEKYAPTWNRFMEEQKLVYNGSLAADGKLYGLPYIDFAPYDRNLRDQWIIMDSWLEELQLPVPKTTEEFKNTLKAFKDNAGKGSIPSDVIPYYFAFDSYVGGQFDIYGSFGVYITNADYLMIDNGTVKEQSTNPAIKEPLKYLRELYEEGLIPPEVFTDDFNTYASKISSSPPIVGSYHSYANRQPDLSTAMGPIDSGNGTKGLIRSQAYVAGPANVAVVTKNNKYPAATVRLMEAIATDPELLLLVTRGLKGIAWDTDSNGKAYQLFWEESPDKMAEHAKEIGMNNSFVGLKDQKFYEEVWNEITYEEKNSRAWAFENVYKDVVMPSEWVFVEGALGEDDANMMKQYRADLTNYRKAVFADFITGKKDIDNEWDAYVEQMKKLGLDQFIELKQKGYDLMVK